MSDSDASPNPLISLRGIAEELFKELGGGEHFIRSERDALVDYAQKS
jgi:hypothetical protein